MTKKNILFLCTGNTCRSQMAEGWAKFYFSANFDVYSAGTKKHGLNPRAVKVMEEFGVDIANHKSKTTDELPNVVFDLVVTVCDSAKEHCPYYPGSKTLHKSFDDPPSLASGLTDEEAILKIYRRVCGEIKDYIKSLSHENER